MQGNKKNKNLLKIAAVTSMTIFSLMAVFTGTLAWFNANRVISNNGNDMQIERLSCLVESVSIHHLANEIDYINDPSTLLFNSNFVRKYNVNSETNAITYEAGQDGGTLGLNQYSLLGNSHPILFLFKLTGSYEPSEVTIQLEVPATVGGQTNYWLEQINDNGAPYSPLALSGNPFSSVVRYRTIGLSALPNTLSFESSALSSFDSFVKINSDGTPNFTTTQREKMIRFEEEYNFTYVGIVFDYYKEAMEYVYSINIGNAIFNDLTTDIGFVFDWILKF
ncbi:MAG: hypothetical protein K6B65_05280 [Bacilli bacterium]|nr:hypothetical protein [Bacilli bacterium]